MNMEQKKCDILLKNARFLNEDMRIVTGKDIAIQANRIVSIAAEPEYTADQVIDGKGLLWMPGLVDGHTHTSQQFLRGRLLDEKPVIWKRVNVPFESRLTQEGSRLSAEVSALEMIKNGTTAFLDAGGSYVDAFAEAFRRSGLRCALTYMTTDAPGAPDSLRVTPESGVARLRKLRQALDGDDRMSAFYSITNPMACSAELIHQVFREAKEQGIPTEVHMNEYPSEVFDFIERYQMRPFEYFEEQGLIGEQFMASHCICLSQSEINILKRHNVRVAHCPFSNCGKGVPATPQLLHEGISVGFGTDGSAHGGMDLFKEMRLFRGVMNERHGICTADPQVMPAETLLRMATSGGAGTLMREDLGIIREGYLADLIAIDLDQPHIFPTQNLVHTLVESVSGNDVKHMIVNGKLLMKNREVLSLDEDKIRWEVGRHIRQTEMFKGSCAYCGEE